MIDNPFDPFRPLEERDVAIAANRTQLVERIAARLDKGRRGLVVVAGRLGVGKSTLLRALLAHRLSAAGWRPVYVVGSPGLTLEEFLIQVAIALGYGISNPLGRLGIHDHKATQQQQQMGSVQQSTQVTMIQAAIDQGNPPRAWSPAQAASALQRIVAGNDRPVALLIDQAEHLFLGTGSESPLLLFEGIARAVTMTASKVSAVIAIRDESLFRLLPLATAYASVTPDIFAVSGLDATEAEAFVDRALGSYGAAFSSQLLRDVLRRLVGADGTVWPVALHACCRELAEVSRATHRAATARDLRRLGDLSGIVGSLIVKTITEADPPGAADTLFCLHVVADFCRLHGSVSLDTLTETLSSFPVADVARMLDLLRSLRLLDEPRSGIFRLAHDSVAAAIHAIRHTVDLEDVTVEIDQAVSLWGSTDTYLPPDALGRVRGLLGQRMPTPHLVLLAGSHFAARHQINSGWLETLRNELSDVASRQLISFISGHAARRARVAFTPEEVFVLALRDVDDTMTAAMTGMVAASRGLGGSWRERDFCDALLLAAPESLNRWIRNADLSNWPVGAVRVLLRSILNREGVHTSDMLLDKLWAQVPRVLLPDVLLLATLGGGELAKRLAFACHNSPEIYLRGAALDVAERLDSEVADQLIAAGLVDSAVTVRRRAIFALGRVPEHHRHADLRSLAVSDPSPLVREACLEVLGRQQSTLEITDLLRVCLHDRVDFVRESAVYAAARLASPVDAASIVRTLARDDSPRVREAALRVMAAGNTRLPVADLLADFRGGIPSLRIAAAQLLAAAPLGDVDIVIAEELAKPLAEREALLPTIELAGRRGCSDCVPALAALLSSDDVEVLCETILALSEISPPGLDLLIESLVFHPSVDVRERVVYALGEGGGDRAVPLLLGLLADPSPEIRARAIYGLGRLEASSAAQAVSLMNANTKELQDAITYYRSRVERRS